MEKQPEFITSELAKFDLPAAEIAQMEREFGALSIADVNDKDGYGAVHIALMHVKAKRVAVEKTRKMLKEDSLNYGRMIDGEAKRIFALLEPIETALAAKRQAIDTEKERIRQEKIDEENRVRQEAIDKENARVQVLVDQLLAYGWACDWHKLKAMSPEDFMAELQEAKNSHAEEQERIRQAEEERLAEETRLEMQRAEQARIAQEQRKQAEALRAAQERIEAEQAELEREKERIRNEAQAEENAQRREAELAAAKKQAAEKAIEAERKRAEAERLRQEAEERAKREAAELEASHRPDKDKLLAWALAIQAIADPELSAKKFRDAFAQRKSAITEITNSVLAFAKAK